MKFQRFFAICILQSYVFTDIREAYHYNNKKDSSALSMDETLKSVLETYIKKNEENKEDNKIDSYLVEQKNSNIYSSSINYKNVFYVVSVLFILIIICYFKYRKYNRLDYFDKSREIFYLNKNNNCIFDIEKNVDNINNIIISIKESHNTENLDVFKINIRKLLLTELTKQCFYSHKYKNINKYIEKIKNNSNNIYVIRTNSSEDLLSYYNNYTKFTEITLKDSNNIYYIVDKNEHLSILKNKKNILQEKEIKNIRDKISKSINDFTNNENIDKKYKEFLIEDLKMKFLLFEINIKKYLLEKKAYYHFSTDSLSVTEILQYIAPFYSNCWKSYFRNLTNNWEDYLKNMDSINSVSKNIKKLDQLKLKDSNLEINGIYNSSNFNIFLKKNVKDYLKLIIWENNNEDEIFSNPDKTMYQLVEKWIDYKIKIKNNINHLDRITLKINEMVEPTALGEKESLAADIEESSEKEEHLNNWKKSIYLRKLALENVNNWKHNMIEDLKKKVLDRNETNLNFNELFCEKYDFYYYILLNTYEKEEVIAELNNSTYENIKKSILVFWDNVISKIFGTFNYSLHRSEWIKLMKTYDITENDSVIPGNMLYLKKKAQKYAEDNIKNNICSLNYYDYKEKVEKEYSERKRSLEANEKHIDFFIPLMIADLNNYYITNISSPQELKTITEKSLQLILDLDKLILSGKVKTKGECTPKEIIEQNIIILSELLEKIISGNEKIDEKFVLLAEIKNEIKSYNINIKKNIDITRGIEIVSFYLSAMKLYELKNDIRELKKKNEIYYDDFKKSIAANNNDNKIRALQYESFIKNEKKIADKERNLLSSMKNNITFIYSMQKKIKSRGIRDFINNNNINIENLKKELKDIEEIKDQITYFSLIENMYFLYQLKFLTAKELATGSVMKEFFEEKYKSQYDYNNENKENKTISFYDALEKDINNFWEKIDKSNLDNINNLNKFFEALENEDEGREAQVLIQSKNFEEENLYKKEYFKEFLERIIKKHIKEKYEETNYENKKFSTVIGKLDFLMKKDIESFKKEIEKIIEDSQNEVLEIEDKDDIKENLRNKIIKKIQEVKEKIINIDESFPEIDFKGVHEHSDDAKKLLHQEEELEKISTIIEYAEKRVEEQKRTHDEEVNKDLLEEILSELISESKNLQKNGKEIIKKMKEDKEEYEKMKKKNIEFLSKYKNNKDNKEREIQQRYKEEDELNSKLMNNYSKIKNNLSARLLLIYINKMISYKIYKIYKRNKIYLLSREIKDNMNKNKKISPITNAAINLFKEKIKLWENKLEKKGKKYLFNAKEAELEFIEEILKYQINNVDNNFSNTYDNFNLPVRDSSIYIFQFYLYIKRNKINE